MSLARDHSPYQGADSFALQDRAFLFGRASDASRIIDMIETRQFSLVHAQSGAGKTSLLRARVLPELDDAGHDAVYFTPKNDPDTALRAAVLLRVVSPPGREAAALEQALSAVPDGLDRSKITLAHLRAIYAEAKPSDPAHKDMIADVSDHIPPALSEPEGVRQNCGVSMVARLLALPEGPGLFFQYLQRLAHLTERGDLGLTGPDAMMSIRVSRTMRMLSDIAQNGVFEEKIADPHGAADHPGVP